MPPGRYAEGSSHGMKSYGMSESRSFYHIDEWLPASNRVRPVSCIRGMKHEGIPFSYSFVLPHLVNFDAQSIIRVLLRIGGIVEQHR